jgi:hypothetical protein
LGIGSVIQVLWDLADSSESESEGGGHGSDTTPSSTTPRWWQCSISRTDGTHTIETEGEGEDEVQIYILQYVADAALGWGEEDPDDLQNRTYFLDDHVLYDLEFGGVLYWRKLGDVWEPPPTAAPTSPNPATAAPAPTAAPAQTAAERLVGQVIAELAAGHAQYLVGMDRTVAISVAETLVSAQRAAVDLVTEWMVESEPGAPALTVEECVARFQLHQRQQSHKGGGGMP